MRSVHGAAARQTHFRRVSVAMPGSTRPVVVLGKEGIGVSFFSFILKAYLHSNAIWCFEGNNFVCPDLCCCFRRMIVLLINSWYKTSVVFRSRKLIMRTEAEPRTQWSICLN